MPLITRNSRRSLLLLALLSLLTRTSAGTLPVWVEAEHFSSISIDPKRAVSQKPPASGGASTAGAAFIRAGSALRYDLKIDHSIPAAKLVLRFARLHFRDSMRPVQLKISVENGGHRSESRITCGNTGGWGTHKASEWHWAETPLGLDLLPGPAVLRLSVDADNSNVNLDGCFLAPQNFHLRDAETRDLERIQISEHGFLGLRIPGDTVFPGAFDRFAIVGQGFAQRTRALQLYLEHGNGDRTPLGDPFAVHLGPEPHAVNFEASVFGPFADGPYTLVVSTPDQGDLMAYPVSIMRDLVKRARSKARDFRSMAEEFRGRGNSRARVAETQWRLIPDLDHAAEFIENVIYVLEARQRGESTSSERAAALAYFEKSPARTAERFAHDLERIISQTDQSLSAASSGRPAYAHRTGDFRRAFYSTATGALEPYRVFIPEAYDALDSIPLLLMLHGGGGDENYFPDLDNGAVLKVLEDRPYLMLSPKCTSWYRGPGAADLAQLIEATLENYPKVDPKRLYCTGVSAGGAGTFELAMAYPKTFRAITCVSSGPRITDAIERLGALPIMMLQGADDVVVPPERARAADVELERRGHPHKLIVFPGYGHEYHGKEYLNLTLDFFESHLP